MFFQQDNNLQWLLQQIADLSRPRIDFQYRNTSGIDAQALRSEIEAYAKSSLGNRTRRAHVWLLHNVNSSAAIMRLYQDLPQLYDELRHISGSRLQGIWVVGFVRDFHPRQLAGFAAILASTLSRREIDCLQSIIGIGEDIIDELRGTTDAGGYRDRVLVAINYLHLREAPVLKRNPTVVSPGQRRQSSWSIAQLIVTGGKVEVGSNRQIIRDVNATQSVLGSVGPVKVDGNVGDADSRGGLPANERESLSMTRKSSEHPNSGAQESGGEHTSQTFSDVHALQSAIGTRGKVTIRENVAESSSTDLTSDVRESLATLAAAIKRSNSLGEKEKEAHLEILEEVRQEASTPNPRKSRLKVLTQGLLVALREVPDVVDTVEKAAQALPRLWN